MIIESQTPIVGPVPLQFEVVEVVAVAGPWLNCPRPQPLWKTPIVGTFIGSCQSNCPKKPPTNTWADTKIELCPLLSSFFFVQNHVKNGEDFAPFLD